MLSEMNEQETGEDHHSGGCAMLMDCFRNQVENRDRDHESGRNRDHLLEGWHAPTRSRYDCRRSCYICTSRDECIRDCLTVHAAVNERRSAAAVIAAERVGAGARSQDCDRHDLSAREARSSSPFP